FTADSRMLVTAPSLRYWNTDTGQLQHSLTSPGRPPLLKLTCSARRAVEILTDESVKVWDLDRRSQLLRIPGYTLSAKNFMVRTALLSSDGQRLVTGGGGPVSIWDLNNGAHLGHIDIPEKETIISLRLSPDGMRLIGHLATKSETGKEDVFQL